MKRCCACFLVCLIHTSVLCQQIQYSRQLIKPQFSDGMHLVADVRDNHHLLFFRKDRSPQIYIFNTQLQFIQKAELNISIRSNTAVKILPFKEYYLVYTHEKGYLPHQLSMVKPNGEVQDISFVFSQAKDSLWNRSSLAFQLYNINEQLCILSTRYFDSIKKVGFTIVKFDSSNQTTKISKGFINYDPETEILKQVSVNNDYLFVLRTGRGGGVERYLEFTKINFINGTIQSKRYSSGQHEGQLASFIFNETDSSFLIYAMLDAFDRRMGNNPAIFFARLDFSLQELTQGKVLSSQFNKYVRSNYLVFTDTKFGWINLRSPTFQWGTFNPLLTQDGFDYYPQINLKGDKSDLIRLTILNEELKFVKDSSMKVNTKYYQIDQGNFAQFVVNSEANLMFVQNFSSKSKGLLRIRQGKEFNFVIDDLRVFDRYDYHLNETKLIKDNSVIIPFNKRNEFGLMRIDLQTDKS